MIIEEYFRFLYNNVVKNSSKKFKELLDENGQDFLDLGCWDGENTLKYGKKVGAKKLFGIEIEKNKAKIASNRGITVKISNLNNKFPFKDSSMDIVVANHVIEHLTQTEQFIKEIFRVLKKDGYCVIATPNLASWHNVFALIFGMQPFSGPHVRISSHDIKALSKMDKDKAKNIIKSSTESNDYLRHLVVMTYKELIKNFKNAGFTVEESHGFGYYPFPPLFANIFSKIDIWHSHYLVIKMRK